MALRSLRRIYGGSAYCLALLAQLVYAFSAPAAAIADQWDVVSRVVDGDTVILEGVGRARLAGIDAPESVRPEHAVEPFGREASHFARQWLSGKRVRIDWDLKRQDRYGRWLVYLYLEDGTFVNAELIRRGWAVSYTFDRLKHTREFLQDEARARAAGVGLWAGPAHGPYHGNRQSGVYHSEVCEYYDCSNCTVPFASRLLAEGAGLRPHWSCVKAH